MSRNVQPEVHYFDARDGTKLSAAVYRPERLGPVPALFAASPYRFDNNTLPASPQFLWRETGPIEFYVSQEYAYVHLDLRGCGRSGGEFGFLSTEEQTDLYDAVEWIGQQDWCTGKVGSTGQSYFCMVQWFLAIQAPPSLACVGAHDGLADAYRAGCYHGGIPCDFFPGYWWYQNRFINRHPATGPSREQATDLARLFAEHPLRDEFWLERSAYERLGEIKVPLFSSGVWSKVQLHARGNIDGFLKAQGPKKLRMSGVPNGWAASQEFNSVEFHRTVMLPFYDHYLKGLDTSWSDRPTVEYEVRGSDLTRVAETWPPPNITPTTFYLSGAPSESLTSLNDGSLVEKQLPPQGSCAYTYPNPGWVSGTAGFGPEGPSGGFDVARRILTYTTPALEEPLEIAGPIKLVLYVSSTQPDADILVRLSEQLPQAAEDRAAGRNPQAVIVSYGWLRASHRALDDEHSSDLVPIHTHDHEEPLTPGEIYQLQVRIEPQAYLFKKGSRVRLEVANGDSPVTEALWPHYYRPDHIGTDTIHHGGASPSAVTLPVTVWPSA